MSFLAPWMFWGSLAAAVPIGLHFFYRTRYRTVSWAAMDFLLAGVRQTNRRIQFRELILLLLRVALFALLALALARPSFTFTGPSGRGEAVDAVLVLDNSYSMATREGTQTRLDKARTAALAVLDGLPPGSTAQVVSCADRARLLGPNSSTNLDQARQLIETLPITDLATDFLPGVQQAADALKAGRGNREVYFFSDMQKLGWDQQAGVLREQFEALRNQARIHFVRCGTQKPRNAAVVGIVPQAGMPHTGERAIFSVLVRNSGTEPVADLTVNLHINGALAERDAISGVSLEGGQTRAIPLSARIQQAGTQILTATVGPDDLDADNRFDFVLQVQDRVQILVIDGNPNERDPPRAASYYLLHSLLPTDPANAANYPLRPVVSTAARATPAMLDGIDACILVDVPLQADGVDPGTGLRPEFTAQLSEFVHQGHGLLIFCGPHVNAAAYNQVLGDQHHLLPLWLEPGAAVPAAHELHLDLASLEPRSYLAAFRDKPLSSLERSLISGFVHTRPPDNSPTGWTPPVVDCRYADGQVALATRRVVSGNVMLCTTGADLAWNDLPLRPTYAPLIHVLVQHLLQSPLGGHNVRAGEPLLWHPPGASEREPQVLLTPAGERINLGMPVVVDGRAEVRVADTERAGVYRVMPRSGAFLREDVTHLEGAAAPAPVGGVFAVTPDLRESQNLDVLTDKEMDDFLGFAAVHLAPGQSPESLAMARLRREGTIWLLAAAVGLVLLETAWAWYCGRGW